MDIIKEIKNGDRILFDRRDVVEILEKQREELIEKAQQWAEDWFCNGEEWMRRTEFVDGVKEDIRRAMEGGRQ